MARLASSVHPAGGGGIVRLTRRSRGSASVAQSSNAMRSSETRSALNPTCMVPVPPPSHSNADSGQPGRDLLDRLRGHRAGRRLLLIGPAGSRRGLETARLVRRRNSSRHRRRTWRRRSAKSPDRTASLNWLRCAATAASMSLSGTPALRSDGCSALRPVPRRPVEPALADDGGLAELLDQLDQRDVPVAPAARDQRRGQRPGVGDDHDLGALGGVRSARPRARQQVGVQAGLRLVEDEQARRARRQQGGHPAAGSAGCRRTARRTPSGRSMPCWRSATSNRPPTSAISTRLPVERAVDRRGRAPRRRRSRGSSAARRPGRRRRGSSTGVRVPIWARRAGAPASVRTWS